MIVLYEHPTSPYAQKVKIALRQKGIAFETKLPEIGGGKLAGSAFSEANPRAEMPTLIDGDTKIFDSTIILEYIEEQWPEPPLLPGHPAERARVRMIEEVMDTYYEPFNWGLAEIIFFGRVQGDLAEQMTAKAKAQLAMCYDWLIKQLGDREWFNGDRMGWGDLAVAPHVNLSIHALGIAPVADSSLAHWFQRVTTCASIAQTLQEANAALGDLKQFALLLEQGRFKREYRDHRLEWMIRMGGIQVVLDGIEKHNIRFSCEFY